MTSRKTRRNTQQKSKISNTAMKKLILMFVAIVVMIFSISQVYFLAKYTLGREVPANKLKIYRWVQLLVNGDTQAEPESNVKE